MCGVENCVYIERGVEHECRDQSLFHPSRFSILLEKKEQ
jgi:hypothetical protein